LITRHLDEKSRDWKQRIQWAIGRCIQLKREQHKTVQNLLKGKYVFAILPTGYAKSFIIKPAYEHVIIKYQALK
jgi:hypothetical protein